MLKRWTEYAVDGLALKSTANSWVINSFYRLQGHSHKSDAEPICFLTGLCIFFKSTVYWQPWSASSVGRCHKWPWLKIGSVCSLNKGSAGHTMGRIVLEIIVNIYCIWLLNKASLMQNVFNQRVPKNRAIKKHQGGIFAEHGNLLLTQITSKPSRDAENQGH